MARRATKAQWEAAKARLMLHGWVRGTGAWAYVWWPSSDEMATHPGQPSISKAYRAQFGMSIKKGESQYDDSEERHRTDRQSDEEYARPRESAPRARS